MTETPDETAPLPVPGFEHLVWREPDVRIPVAGAKDHRPELVSRGEDVALVFTGGPFGNIDELSSLRIERPFASWPPRCGTPAVHAPRELYNGRIPVAPWRDDELIFLLDEPFVARCGEPGARPLGIDVVARDEHGREMAASMGSARPFIGANLEHGVYMVRWRREVHDGPSAFSLEHRSLEQLDVARDIAPLPQHPGPCAVLDDGSFMFVVVHAPPGPVLRGRRARDTPVDVEVELFQTTESGLVTRGRWPAPPNTKPTGLLAARGGGAWVFFEGPHTEAVQRLGTDGQPRGGAWMAPFPRGYRTRLLPWADGFLLVTDRGGIAVLASDGSHTSRVASPPVGEPLAVDHLTALASADGRSVLVAHALRGHVRLLRADFGEAGQPSDPWADDRARSARARAAAAARAAAPPRRPGRPVETTSDGTPPPCSHAKERIVRQVRMRHVLCTISGLHFGEFTRFRGDATAGSFFDDDGCGNFVAFGWSADGLIGVGFDHEMNPDAGADESELEPEQYFEQLPAALRPIFDALMGSVRKHATGGLWVTTGEDPRWRESGAFPDDFARYTMLPEPSVFDAMHGQSWLELTSVSEAQARLAIRLAADAEAGPREVTPEEETILLRAPEGERELDERRLLAAAKALAWAGVRWTAAETRAAAGLEEAKQAALEALGEPQVALLRAAHEGNRALVDELLAGGADPRCVAFQGMFDRAVDGVRYLAHMTPLALATLRGHADVVDALLATVPEGEAGAKLEGGALRVAAVTGDADMVARLATRLPLERELFGLAFGDVGGAAGVRKGPSLAVATLLFDRGLVPHGRLARFIAAAAEAAGDEALAARARAHVPSASAEARPPRRPR